MSPQAIPTPVDLFWYPNPLILLFGQDHAIFSIGVILGLVILYTVRYRASPYRKLPPGPRGFPIIGNLLELREAQWLKFTELQKKYGDIIYLNAVGQPMIILNSRKVASDLLERRAAVYSDRPTNIVGSELMCNGLFFVFTRYGDIWRRMRKASHVKFNKDSSKEFHETLVAEAVLLAHKCLVDSKQWDDHFRRCTKSTMRSVLYGPATREHGSESSDDVIAALDDFAGRLAGATYPGAHLVEFFPWMRHIPSRFAKWKRNAENSYKQDTEVFKGLLRGVEDNVVKGDDHRSVGATFIRRNMLSSIERAWLLGGIFLGGADTTSSMMAWWPLAMLVYPETQARAHAELDAVVGRTRPPTFADQPHLPYIRAMVKEILRWRPNGPLGVPHRSTEDDWYEGMFIPKGTICIPNVWHMNRDPEVYGEDAADFNPARYLDASDDIGSNGARENEHVSYGFGNRVCLGRHVSDNSIFINIAVMLWASKIERKKDESGQLIPLDVDGCVAHGLLVRPAPFDLEITPRFPEALSLLAQERELRGK